MPKHAMWTQTNRNKDDNRSMGLAGLFDSTVMSLFQLTDELYDKVCEEATEEELNTIIDCLSMDEDKKPSFTTKRKALEVIHKFKEKYPELNTKELIRKNQNW